MRTCVLLVPMVSLRFIMWVGCVMMQLSVLFHNKLSAVLNIYAFLQMVRIHAASLEVIDGIVGYRTNRGGHAFHAIHDSLVGIFARIDIDAVAFGVVIVLQQ